MNKRMRELQTLIINKTAEAEAFMAGENKDVAKATALMDEVDGLQAEMALEKRLEKAGKASVPAEPQPQEKKQEDTVKAFANAARSRFKANLSEAVGADGGYTVPEDISTAIRTLKEERFSLASLIRRESVSTLSGARTYKTRAQHTGFTVVGEGTKIGQTSQPAFSRVEYAIKKYGGWLPVTNELLADSDAAIYNTITNWLAEESVATENAQILAALQQKDATAFTGLKDLKKAVNVTLAAFAGSVRIITNSDGLQYLDTLEDANKRPLLSPDPVKPMEMYVSVGVRRIPVTVVPNAVLATDAGKIPFFVGDLHEYMTMFDRQQLSLSVSDTAAVTGFNAFEQDMTLFRGLMRADFVVTDTEALVYGQITQA